MRVKFHPGARSDLREGRAFYRHRSPVAAVAFAHEIARAIERIVEAPMRSPAGEYGTREHVLARRFKTIVYQVSDVRIVIVAVAHHSREAGYWHDRS